MSAILTPSLVALRAASAAPLRMPLRIGICSTYAPRACGLATFAGDLRAALIDAPNVAGVSLFVLDDGSAAPVIDDGSAPPVHSITTGWSATPADRAITMIADSDPTSYRAAAQRANSACDVMIEQHEFGIFGGRDGAFVLELLDALTIPVVLTLHTVLANFTEGQRNVLRRAVRDAAIVTVFTETARRQLLAQGIGDEFRVQVVPHGAPHELYDADAHASRSKFAVQDRFVLSTFGLVSAGKGIELAIDAMPTIVEAQPDAVFLVAGRTHPAVARREGERYREQLVARVESNAMQQHVRFIDQFLSIGDIAGLLAATDIFLTPYMNAAQCVSGALTFALAAGCPVVSTPYQYASDVLAGGAGTIVQTRDPVAFAEAVLHLGLVPQRIATARDAAARFGEPLRWSNIGTVMAAACSAAVAARSRVIDLTYDLGGAGRSYRTGRLGAAVGRSAHLDLRDLRPGFASALPG